MHRMVRSTEGKTKFLRKFAVAAMLFAAPLAAGSAEQELDTPYVPTPQVVVDRMLELAQIKKGDMVIDLGSGDGRLVITAAQKYGAHGFGVELDPRLVTKSNDEARRAGLADRVKFLQQDLFDTDFRQANVLTLYLLPDVNLKLRPKILEELKPGTRVVSHDYGMREWQPDAEQTIAAPDKTVGARKASNVYLWIVPAKVAGEWAVEIRSGKKRQQLPLSLTQHYQRIAGSVGVGSNQTGLNQAGLNQAGSNQAGSNPAGSNPAGSGRPDTPVTDARIRGEEVRFALPAGVVGAKAVEFVGLAKGDVMSGSVRTGDRVTATWRAHRRAVAPRT